MSEAKKMLINAMKEKHLAIISEYRNDRRSTDEFCGYEEAYYEILELVKGILP